MMNDYQKWLEAAAGIAQDIEYLKQSLNQQDLASLQVALSVYVSNARTGVAWPKPDDLYCISTANCGSKIVIETETREGHKIAC
jgi:hypothetical protein